MFRIGEGEERDPKGRGGVGFLGKGQLAKPRPLLILVLFKPRLTLVETTIVEPQNR